MLYELNRTVLGNVANIIVMTGTVCRDVVVHTCVSISS